jgi:single-stranded DNA-specific DHH superfamily exonuclease
LGPRAQRAGGGSVNLTCNRLLITQDAVEAQDIAMELDRLNEERRD